MAGADVIFTVISFPQGLLLLVKSGHLIKEIKYLPSNPVLSSYLTKLEQQHGTKPLREEANFKEEINLFLRYFQGHPVNFNHLPLDFNQGTPFQVKVWQEAQNIPYGQTITYKELAHRINHSGYRSVGQALGRNPFLIAVPCHRVLSSDGRLGGFTAGLNLKKYLLSLEGARK